MATQLEALVQRVAELDAALASDITVQLKHAARDREFGLVFNRHMPEMVELYGRTVRRGDKVHLVNSTDKRTWVVRKTHGRGGDRTAELVSTEATADTCEAPVSDLVVVADFDDPIYPGLRSTHRIERGGDKPTHVVINAENYHALSALQFTHTEKVDCIYIDPPYNTGGDLTYNDKRVAREDANKHSKWLSFMERRLKLAKELLKPTGVIIAAIDDNEHAYLKLLMDKIFGESNFIANVVWQGSGKNNARFTAGGVDYMLIYARDQETLRANDVKWRERKDGLDEVYAAASDAWDRSGHDTQKATRMYRAELRKLKGSLEPAVFRYDSIDDQGRVYRRANLSAQGGARYDLPHPVTNKPCRVPSTGWRYTVETMVEMVESGRILFGDDETVVPEYKRFLNDVEEQIPYPTFTRTRMIGTSSLEKVFNERRFDYPKDTTVLARWIGIVTGHDPDAVVLDFFGGSGSTMHAVMNMNAADGGRRQCILVTNNEVNEKTEKELRKQGLSKGDPEWESQGIHSRVTRPRIETVVTGIREDGSQYSDGLDENVEFFDLTYEDAERVRLDMAYEAVSPMLWLRAGGRGSRIDARTDGFAVADDHAVLFSPDKWKQFTAALKGTTVKCVYVVTDNDALLGSVCDHLPPGIDTVRLYEDFLSTFVFTSGS